MKFARYLEETRPQIPEWKRAYIDFKGLKKRVAAIRKAKQGLRTAPSHLPNSTRYESMESPVRESVQPRSYGTLNHSRSPSRSLPPRPSITSQNDQTHDTGSTFPSLSGTITRRKSIKAPLRSEMTIESLYSSLEPFHLSFFTYLDRELDKVQTFYNEREREAVLKLSALRDQLDELADHRRKFYEAQTLRGDSWTAIPRVLGEALGVSNGRGTEITDPHSTTRKVIHSMAPSQSHSAASADHFRDPAEYHHAKRKLKKAFEEFYRSLELLSDYRVLNLTGFRKALKKYEKVTQIQVQDLYIKEKIHPLSFAFSGTMDDAMREVEDIYTTRFENGDRKKARHRLKYPILHKSHHFSTFRSGLYIGIAIPLLISAVSSSFQLETRRKIPEWGPLLEIYATLLIPVVFSLLLGVNISAWTCARINFVFIFELDVRTAIDTREYFELPAFLFCTLSLATWLSFCRIGSLGISPTAWPLIWLGLALAILINPFPIFSRSSRYWLIKNTFRLLVPGASRVEFTDFWLGDQFCSLVFSLGHMFTLGCAYSSEWQNVEERCESATIWPAPFVLLALPYTVRLMQSARRYHDSRLLTHLINGGKYLSSIVVYAMYYTWRSRGSPRDISFVMWCLFATLSSIYASLWDLLMDWSVLQRGSPHIFLRPELVYTNNPELYYFAIVSNIAIRFLWTIYIPSGGLNSRVRAVIAAGLEMLRRFQWNFYRLENEQIGNTDQYRATREVPLPYFPTRPEEDDEDDSDLGEGEDNNAPRDTLKLRAHESKSRSSKMLGGSLSKSFGGDGGAGAEDEGMSTASGSRAPWT